MPGVLAEYASFSYRESACEMFCAQVNACEHSVRATPDSWVAGQPDRVDGHTIDATGPASTALSARSWTFDEALPSCPQVLGLQAIHARVLDEPTRGGVWGAVRLRSDG